MERGTSRRGFGRSSAKCVVASGVPIVKAPFNTPIKNATPSDQPVTFANSLHTKEFVACCVGIAATTMTVISPPTHTMKRPKRCT